MPRPDPLPSSRLTLMRRFWRIFRLLALLSIVIAAIAVLLVARGDPTIHIHLLIATALGIGLTVLLETFQHLLELCQDSWGEHGS